MHRASARGSTRPGSRPRSGPRFSALAKAPVRGRVDPSDGKTALPGPDGAARQLPFPIEPRRHRQHSGDRPRGQGPRLRNGATFIAGFRRSTDAAPQAEPPARVRPLILGTYPGTSERGGSLPLGAATRATAIRSSSDIAQGIFAWAKPMVTQHLLYCSFFFTLAHRPQMIADRAVFTCDNCQNTWAFTTVLVRDIFAQQAFSNLSQSVSAAGCSPKPYQLDLALHNQGNQIRSAQCCEQKID